MRETGIVISKKRLLIFGIVFLVMNLSFVPLLATYGLQVCPVLRINGFFVGCTYTGSYVAIVFILNMLITFLLTTPRGQAMRLSGKIVYPLIYVFASVLALFFLRSVWQMQHITQESRAPQILILASFLLGLTQYYGLFWAIPQNQQSSGPSGLKTQWIKHSIRVMAPVFVAIVVLLHYILSQQAQFPDVPSSRLRFSDMSAIVYFVTSWMAVTYLFHFLSEKDCLDRIYLQLNDIELKQQSFQRPESNWGLWSFLTYRLNQFSNTLAERNRLLNSFSRFVAKNVAEKALGEELDRTSGREVELTVMMSDIRNFTAMSESLAPDEVINLLNRYFSKMIESLGAHGIIIDKFIGDGILAYVEPQGDSSKENSLAIMASKAMLRELEALNSELAETGLPRINIGIGVHRGKVVQGLIGSSTRLEHTIIGDTVNRTARLESLCKEFAKDVIISSSVFDLMAIEFVADFEHLGSRKIKGLQEEMSVYGM